MIKRTLPTFVPDLLGFFEERLVAVTETRDAYYTYLRGAASVHDYGYLGKILAQKKLEVFPHAELTLVDVCDTFRPLVGDICISVSRRGGRRSKGGTAGFVANADGHTGFVTAEHVAGIRQEVFQPDFSPGNRIGHVEKASNDEFVDASFVRTDDYGYHCSAELYSLGTVAGALPYADINEDIRISWAGRGSGGRVDGSVFAVGSAGGKHNQIEFKPPPQPGDSGAAIAAEGENPSKWKVLGIIWAQILVGGSPVSGIACNYDTVADSLQVKIDVSP